MAINHKIPELDRKGLREFGLMTGAVVVVIFGLFFPWLLELNWPVWPWIIAAPLWSLALVYPLWLRRVYLRAARKPGNDAARARDSLFRYDFTDCADLAPHRQRPDAEIVRSESKELPGSEHKESERKTGETFLMLDLGSTGRPVGVHAGAKEVLACPDNRRNAPARRSDRIRAGIVARPIYLHAVLAV
jgi:hypothetical protein